MVHTFKVLKSLVPFLSFLKINWSIDLFIFKKVSLIQTLTGHTDTVAAFTVLKNGNFVSGSWDKTIKIWNPTTGALIQTLTGHTSYVWTFTILQNGNLVSGSADETIIIWSIDNEGTLNIFSLISLNYISFLF